MRREPRRPRRHGRSSEHSGVWPGLHPRRRRALAGRRRGASTRRDSDRQLKRARASASQPVSTSATSNLASRSRTTPGGRVCARAGSRPNLVHRSASRWMKYVTLLIDRPSPDRPVVRRAWSRRARSRRPYAARRTASSESKPLPSAPPTVAAAVTKAASRRSRRPRQRGCDSQETWPGLLQHMPRIWPRTGARSRPPTTTGAS